MFPSDPPEKIRKPKVFLCFQRDQKETLERNGVKVVSFFLSNYLDHSIHDF